MIEISRDIVERMAKIIGQDSAFARAIKCADEHDGPVAFFKDGNSIIVQKDWLTGPGETGAREAAAIPEVQCACKYPYLGLPGCPKCNPSKLTLVASHINEGAS